MKLLKKSKTVVILALIISLITGVMSGCVTPEDKPDIPDKITEIDKGEKNNPSFTFVTDGELAVSTVSKQDTVNKLQATDDFGRSTDYIDGYKSDKERYVGLFYFTWLGWHGGEMSGIYDVSKLLDDNPSALWNTAGTPDSPIGKYHHWGEPLYGYYNSKDPWVIRKQIELFTLSGIDFIAFDCTNGFTYVDVVSVILPIMQEYYDAGWNVPKFMFYLNTQSAVTSKLIYSGGPSASGNIYELEGIYKKGYFQDLWFAPEGKPRLAAITDPASTNGEGAGRPEDHIITDPEILNFFQIWESTWPNKTQYENGLPWMDWTRPQKVFTDTINVGVAHHNKLPFSDALLSGGLAEEMWGRGYTSAGGANHSDEAIESAQNFEEQWAYALEQDVKYTFVTGWNEWVAIKSAANLGLNNAYPELRKNRVFFVDTVNKEYSRDIEMMKGGYADNVFLSLLRNTRTYKGNAGTLSPSVKQAIDISKGLAQWAGVADVYYDFGGAMNRNFKNFSGQEVLTDSSMLNDITQVRVTHDKDNVYFLIECSDDIKINVENNNWMNLLIDVEGQAGEFYGYDYIINRQSSYLGLSGVEKVSKSGSKVSYSLEGAANFSINGRYMQYKVPKTLLGISGTFRINFKVADNVTEPEDMQSYYITGDVAPVGRLNYIFKG